MGAPEAETERLAESQARRQFVDLLMELPGSEPSRFTARDTPTFTCLARSLDEALDSLG